MRRFGVLVVCALALGSDAWAQQAVSPDDIRKAEATLPQPVARGAVRPVSHREAVPALRSAPVVSASAPVAAITPITESPTQPDPIAELISADAQSAPISPTPVSSVSVAGPVRQGGIPVVIGAHIGEQADGTRFVIELSDPLKMRVFTLASPNRVVVDMPQVLWRLNAADKPTGQGAVKAYRYGLFRPGDSRFVIDLKSPVATGEPMILPPENGYGYRVVLDLSPTTQSQFEKTAGWPADLRAKENVAEKVAAIPPSLKPVLPGVPSATKGAKVIVIDPGHGGIDSGTIAYDRSMEKDLVLDEGKRLARGLQSRGYIVHMTRDTDIYIPLRERVDIARGYNADLMISLHADSNPDPAVNGGSIYTLSTSGSDREAAALAQRENQSDIIAGVDLTGQDDTVSHILIDMAQRDTINQSVRFALAAVNSMQQVTDILTREPHRSAGFAVLKAPDVPAVLIELGYLSNPHDCAQMATPGWRDAVATAIAGAVDRQFGRAAVPALDGTLASQRAE